VYGKVSLLTKMPGDEWQKFANLRSYLAFMWCHPGKKLLFMGSEIAQPSEWNHDGSVTWDVLDQLIIMQHGRIVASGAPQDVLSENLLRNVFSVEASIETSPYHS
ncbi:hypothetical protein ACC754_37255, partial [Rhizobium johnstonii]